MTFRRTIDVCVATLAVGMVLAAPPVQAQQTQGPITPKPGTPVQQAPEGTIRVRVALVRAPVVVIDGKGEPILDLEQKDFRVLDDGADQAIESIDLGGEPLSAVLVFETSSRIAPLLPAVQKSLHANRGRPFGRGCRPQLRRQRQPLTAVQLGQRQNRKDNRQLEARQQRRAVV
jgi:hypothetical protein